MLFVFALKENLLVVVRGTRGHSAMTSLISGDRRAVSIAQRVSFSFGGSMKRHDERTFCGIANGVGHDRFPIHAMKKGGTPEFFRCHVLVGEA